MGGCAKPHPPLQKKLKKNSTADVGATMPRRPKRPRWAGVVTGGGLTSRPVLEATSLSSQILKNWWMIDSKKHTVEQHERNTRVFKCVVSLAASNINQPLQKDGARSSVGIRPRCQRTFCCSHCSDFDTRARCTTRGTRPWGPCSLPCQPSARCVWISRLLPHTPMAPVGHGRGFV